MRRGVELKTLSIDLKQNLQDYIDEKLERCSPYELRNELYKIFRTPPFVITKDKKVIFIGFGDINQ